MPAMASAPLLTNATVTAAAAGSPVILAKHVAPTASKPTTIVPKPSPATPNLLQSIQEPLPPTSLESVASSPPHVPIMGPSASQMPSTSSAPLFSSKVSRETADADAQISQLLETLQKDPQTLTLESEKIAEFIKTLTSDTAPVSTDLTAATGPMPVSQQQMKPLPTSAKPEPPLEKTSGTTGFQASFLNSIANRRISADEDPLQPHQPAKIQIPAASAPPAPPAITSVSPTGITTTSWSSTPSSAVVTMGGGAATQMRALQNLPPNTRLVRGPSGQYTLQKIQTIELSPELQMVRVHFITVRIE